MTEKAKRLWRLTVVFILFSDVFATSDSDEAAESVARKRIAIVLDNSDSMIICSKSKRQVIMLNVINISRWE